MRSHSITVMLFGLSLDVYIRPIYTTEDFWHGLDKNGTRTQKNGWARIHFAV